MLYPLSYEGGNRGESNRWVGPADRSADELGEGSGRRGRGGVR